MNYRHSYETIHALAENRKFLPLLSDAQQRLEASRIYMETDVSDCANRAEAKRRKYAAVFAAFPDAGPTSVSRASEIGKPPPDHAGLSKAAFGESIRDLIKGQDVAALRGDSWITGTVRAVSRDALHISGLATKLEHRRVVPLTPSAETEAFVRYAFARWLQCPKGTTEKRRQAFRLWREKVREIFGEAFFHSL